jgi:tRNA-uridine 2-sulfurtransferase
MNTRRVVAIAMSGGVDSSVAAALLVEQGYDVIGIMLRLWSEQEADHGNRCCSPESMAMARRVASQLSIPFYVLDAREYFYEQVVIPFINDYAHNTTPNPCLFCNRSVRWNFLFNHALAAGADFLATGHYAQIHQDASGLFQLQRGVDPAKDQSYILHGLTQDQLKHTLFPLGGFTKVTVRQIAHRFALPVAERPDSQDLCFVGIGGDYRQFLFRHAPQTAISGEITDLQGNILGQHQGLSNFTIGQRKGLHLNSPTPLYVLEKDLAQNRLVVGPRAASGSSGLVARKVNWISGKPPQSPFQAVAKVRYKAHPAACLVNTINEDSFHLEFDSPVMDITPGQAAVLYNGEVCLGGGIISNEIDKSET